MREFDGYFLFVDDKEAVRRLLHASVTTDKPVDWIATFGHVVPTTLIAGKAARIALDLANANEETVADQLHDQTQILVLLLTVNEQEIAKGRNADMDVDLMAATVEGAAHAVEANVFRVRDLTIDKLHRLVTLRKEEIHLTPTEYELICLLAAQAGGVVKHEQLMHLLWGANSAHAVHLLRVNISNLRRKLDADSVSPSYIVTEPGIGYRLRTS